MTQLTCQICGEQGVIVTPRELEEGLADGRYVKGARLATYTHSQTGEQFTSTEAVVFHVCRDCKRKAAKDANQADGERARHARIMARLAHIRRNNPDMPLEEAATRATEDEFEPENEPNLELRRYLIERQERDGYSKERDAIARDILASLPNE